MNVPPPPSGTDVGEGIGVGEGSSVAIRGMGVSVGRGASVLVGPGGKVGTNVGVAGALQATKTKAVRMTKNVKFFKESPFCCDDLSTLFLSCKDRASRSVGRYPADPYIIPPSQRDGYADVKQSHPFARVTIIVVSP